MPNGFINVLKAPGMSSHDIIGHLRKVYGIKKIGHAGTLDPAAAGVLPVAVGKATRFLEYMDNADKSYKAEVTFGYATDSGDDTGEVIERADDFTLPDAEQVRQALEQFRGAIKQRPPLYSAVLINGERAYKLARKNKNGADIEIDMPEREVMIHDIRFQEMTPNGFVFDCVCSKGTYIRSLCRDIGRALGIPSVMSFLVRSHVGAFRLENAFSTEEIGLLPHKVLLPMDYPIQHLDKCELTGEQLQKAKNGLKVKLDGEVKNFSTKFIRLYDKNSGAFGGIGRYLPDTNEIAPHKMIL